MNKVGEPYYEVDKHGVLWEFIDLPAPPRVCRIGVDPEEADRIDEQLKKEYEDGL